MKKVKIGNKVDNFELESTNKDGFEFKDYKGKRLVIYFYPKDNTSGCTQESIDFSSKRNLFRKLNCEIFGVSRDSIKSHYNFKEKFKFKFDLLSDPNETLCKAFDVMKEKSMYGKKFIGVERSTFFINEKGVLIKEWRKVKVNGHVDEVLAFVKSLY